MLANISSFLNWFVVAVVIVLIVAVVAYLYWIRKRNSQSPVEKVNARIVEITSDTVGNAMVTQQSRNVNLGMVKEKFAVKFKTDDGREYRFIMDEGNAQKMMLHESGVLSYQGDRFVSFETK